MSRCTATTPPSVGGCSTATAACSAHVCGKVPRLIMHAPLLARCAASVSLGEPREFLLRQNTDHSYKYRYRLGGGALLVMAGSMQRHWMHSVPRRATLVGERISLTFRTILRPEAQRSGGGGGDSG